MFCIENGFLIMQGEKAVPWSCLMDISELEPEETKDQTWHPGFKDHECSFDVNVETNGIDDILDGDLFAKRIKSHKPIRKIMLKRASRLVWSKGRTMELTFTKEGDEYVCERGKVRFVLQGL